MVGANCRQHRSGDEHRPRYVTGRGAGWIILAAALSLAGAPVTVGQDDQPPAGSDERPLAPPDTSSPRDTLRSFLESATLAVGLADDFENPVLYRSYHNAIATLDLSTTPDSSVWMVRSLRIILLKEILDRIAVPPDNEIPGDAEVAAQGLTRWTLPDTRITIERIEEGPRAGEFLFSADTVEQLDRFYREVQDMPYKPGATPGLYEGYMSIEEKGHATDRLIRNRLRPVDTSNPRSTLVGFLDSVNRAYALVMEADAALRAQPPTMTVAEAREVEKQARNLLARAAVALELSRVPEALRAIVGLETALRLKEVVDRTQLPPIDSVPNANMVAAAQRASDRAIHWRYPNTEIEIVEILEGDRAGQFLFSAPTVARADEFYQKVRNFDYRADRVVRMTKQYPLARQVRGLLRVLCHDARIPDSADASPGPAGGGVAGLVHEDVWRANGLAVVRPGALRAHRHPGCAGDLPRYPGIGPPGAIAVRSLAAGAAAGRGRVRRLPDLLVL